MRWRCCSAAKAAGSGFDSEVGQHLAQSPQHGGITRHTVDRLFGQQNQAIGMETCGKPPEAHRRNVPVAIASGPAEQVHLPLGTLDEGAPQFADEIRIVPCCGSQIGIKGSTFVGHGEGVTG